MNLVTLSTFQFPAEAYPLKAMLESAGIPVVLINENLISINPLLSNLLGGVQLQVSEEDKKEASIILDLFFKQPPHTTSDIGPEWKRDFDEIQTWCPACDSYPVYQKKMGLGKSILIGIYIQILSFMTFWFVHKKLVCAHCSHKWEQ